MLWSSVCLWSAAGSLQSNWTCLEGDMSLLKSHPCQHPYRVTSVFAKKFWCSLGLVVWVSSFV